MFEEPVRFFVDLVRQRPAGPRLPRRHGTPSSTRRSPGTTGCPSPDGGPDDWVRIDDATPYGRGGLLPMAVFQTANAPGLRTSPVKRGYWVVRRLLGEYIPPPPPDVPDLPDDEADLGDLTLRRGPGPAPGRPGLRRLPRAVRRHRPGLRGVRPDRRAPGRSTSAAVPIDTLADLPRRRRGGRGRGAPGLPRIEPARRVRREPLPEAPRLRPRADPDPLGRRDDRRDAAAGVDRRRRFGGLVEAIVLSPQFRNTRTEHRTRGVMPMTIDDDRRVIGSRRPRGGCSSGAPA